MLEQLKKLTEHVLGITVLFYILGFLVTTVYLNSLGVVWFDAIKPRYIVIGLMFSVFLLSFILPLGILRRLFVQGEIGKNFLALLGISVVTLLVGAGLISFLETSLRLGLRQEVLQPESKSFNKAFEDAPGHFRHSHMIFDLALISILLAILVISYLVLRNKPDGKEKFTKSAKSILVGIAGLVSFSVLGTVMEIYGNIGPKQPKGANSGWNLFWSISLLSYVLWALILFWANVSKPTPPEKDEQGNPKKEERSPGLVWTASWLRLMWLSTYVAPILPVYATVVYPRLVQSVGGGAPVMVELSGTEEQDQPWGDNDTTYIVERNDKDTLLLIKSGDDGRIRIVEVKSEKLGMIEYPDPGTSEAAR